MPRKAAKFKLLLGSRYLILRIKNRGEGVLPMPPLHMPGPFRFTFLSAMEDIEGWWELECGLTRWL